MRSDQCTLVELPDEAFAKARGVKADFVFHQSDATRLSRLLDLVAAGTLTPLVDRVVPLDAFPDACAFQTSGRARGKIIINESRPHTSPGWMTPVEYAAAMAHKAAE